MRVQAAKRSAVFRRIVSRWSSAVTRRLPFLSISRISPSMRRSVTSERRRRIRRLSCERAIAIDFV